MPICSVLSAWFLFFILPLQLTFFIKNGIIKEKKIGDDCFAATIGQNHSALADDTLLYVFNYC